MATAKKDSLVGLKTKTNKADRLIKLAKGGKPESDTVFLNIRIERDMRRKVKIYCAEHDMTGQAFVEKAIAEKLKR
jgi:hypothetical protein